MSVKTNCLTRFLRSERGSFTVEAVVIFPLLVWAYTAMFVFWDAFKTQNINLKATYTIADMISREQEEICTSYIAGATSIYAFLNSGDSNHRVRVSVVRQIPDAAGGPEPDYDFWSVAYPAGTLPSFTAASDFQTLLPIMADYDSVIIVTTATDWQPVFNVGLPPKTLSETVVTSPRFAPRIDVCPEALGST
jgi:hypothetical protein